MSHLIQSNRGGLLNLIYLEFCPIEIYLTETKRIQANKAVLLQEKLRLSSCSEPRTLPNQKSSPGTHKNLLFFLTFFTNFKTSIKASCLNDSDEQWLTSWYEVNAFR